MLELEFITKLDGNWCLFFSEKRISIWIKNRGIENREPMRNIEIGWEKSRELIVPCVRSEKIGAKGDAYRYLYFVRYCFLIIFELKAVQILLLSLLFHASGAGYNFCFFII